MPLLTTLKRRPMLVLAIGVLGISMSSILVRLSAAPSAVTAAYRLLWTVLLMTPAVLGSARNRAALRAASGRTLALSALSGLFLAAHFALWFESLQHTSVASSTTIVCTDAIWVAVGYCLFLRGKLSLKAVAAIAVAFAGSVCIACADSSAGGAHLYGDALALAGAVAIAAYTLLGTVVQRHTTTTVYTYVVYATCAAALVAVCAVQGLPLFGYGVPSLLAGLLLAVFSTVLGHSIFSWCLNYFSPAFVSACKLCEPVLAAIMALFLFGVVPAPLQLLGSALILGGVFRYSRLEAARAAQST